ncbi:transposase [Lewinella sp. IMCC34191]|uniref:IS701 family transposase n=1 Tax=Lewinella sp. IMCC34191 TaxID=2259172 RepID=UPI000E23D6BB|nr:transposase [Lewinella sp. IMCC34191]
MLRFPPEFQTVISAFSPAFRSRVWRKAQTLLLGAICCPGSRTVCNCLRGLGLAQEKRFHKYHRFLSKDKWSALRLSELLLVSLVDAFIGPGIPLVFGIDETIERRWGGRLRKRGIYRDAVRSSGSHFVKCSGLRWMSLMLLAPLPWLTKGCWALPILTALCPSERYWQQRDEPRQHKTLLDWAGQLLAWLARYTPSFHRPVYLVGDGTYATYELMGRATACGVGLITRMRLDARLFHFPPARVAGKRGPKPKIGGRILSMTKRLTDRRIKWSEVVFTEWYGHANKQMVITFGDAIWSRRSDQKVPLRWVLIKDPEGKLDPVLLACTDRNAAAVDIVGFFVRRWRVEVTFAEVRRHLGVETQRQWSDLAVERSTPLLLGLKSVICLLAKPLFVTQKIKLATTAWYPKQAFTFSTILAAVRRQIWAAGNYSTSPQSSQVQNLKARIDYLEQLLVDAAA